MTNLTKNPNIMNYLVVTIKNWNIAIYDNTISKYSGNWFLITDPKQLTLSNLKKINPRYIFFPHWSEIVPSEILNSYECVCFHETDLPYGRGGSPVQNLMLAGHKTSKITAFRMTDELDAGPVYLKKNISLAGTAQKIYEKTAAKVALMIKEIIEKNPQPRPQTGKVVHFKRRKPEQSNLELLNSGRAEDVYNFIRMLDAETYPKAFIKLGKFRLEFSGARKSKTGLTANVTIHPEKNELKK